MALPPLYRVRQLFDNTRIPHLQRHLKNVLHSIRWDGIQQGQSAAVAVGSRGIARLGTLVAAVIEDLKSRGLEPFIIPAMGSHGGATAEGQVRVLEKLGISQSSMGVPIVAGMDAVLLGSTESGAEVFCSRDALAADHLVMINRIKPHTAFRGEVESGLCKMLAVGLGKQKGAASMHKFGLGDSIVPAARMILAWAPVLYGLAVVENALDQIHAVQVVAPDNFVRSDAAMLKLAWQLFPRLPVEDLDILVVDEMGKNISGSGMDPNVVGSWRRVGGERRPDYRVLIVLGLTPESQGNATGIGMADLTTRRMIDCIDLEATYQNTLTSGILCSARLPMSVENDRTALETALSLVPDSRPPRMARIANTHQVETFWATEAVSAELRLRQDLAVEPNPVALAFGPGGRLRPAY